MSLENIVIKGAREHNLKGFDLELPRNKLVVITGLSGSGKSSLAFDTIYAEGQRRYVESLSTYARQFLGQMEKPDVDHIEGLSPAISIEQRSSARNPRSTVGTVTEIYDYLRLLYARVGKPHCTVCGRAIEAQTSSQIVDQLLELEEGTKFLILAPLIRGRKGEHKALIKAAQKEGFVRVRINGETFEIGHEPELDKNKKHTIEVIVDRLVAKASIRRRLSDSVETALRLGSGVITINFADKNEDIMFSENFACPEHGTVLDELSPRVFSFNSPYGACPRCDGLGTIMELDADLIVRDNTLSLNQGAVHLWKDPSDSWTGEMLKTIAASIGFSLDTPWKNLSEKTRNILLWGSQDLEFTFKWESENRKGEWRGKFEGAIPSLQRRYKQTSSQDIRTWIESMMSIKHCPECDGKRLRPEVLGVTINGKSIDYIGSLTIKSFISFLEQVELSPRDTIIAERILKEISERLTFLRDVGLDYLTLNREASTLAGGEAQRIRLATQIGSGLVGVIYILDEPSIGLHQRDNERLLKTLFRLRNLGNTVIVVEHDKETMLSADYIVDLGPGAGVHGGNIVCEGTPDDIKACPSSLTGAFLAGKRSIPVPTSRRFGNNRFLVLQGATANNLKEIDVRFPLCKFICVTGVSGSGKSTLVMDVLHKALDRIINGGRDIPGKFKAIKGVEFIDKVIAIDQSPIGRTPRSNPATYTGALTPIRDLFAELPDAKVRGYNPGRFSFNVKGGRCEACQGDGIIKIEMHFLPDIYVPCEVCKGLRFNRETLEITYKGKNISEVLKMTVEEALDFFNNVPAIRRKLQTLYDVGLGYLQLGQSATTLSGGEAQRIKLSTELAKVTRGHTLYILDEPTTGLHFEDVRMLLTVLNTLVDKGNTVLVIEHNMDVIKVADHIIDLGPEGGDEGGTIIAEGSPEQIILSAKSYTGKFLKPELGHRHG